MTTRKVNLDDLAIKGMNSEVLAIRKKLATAKIGEFVYFADLAIDREWKGFSVGIRNKNRDNAKMPAINAIKTAAKGLRMTVSIYWVPSKGQRLVPRVEVKSK